MSKVIHCKVNMFSAKSTVLVEEDGQIIDELSIPFGKLQEQLPVLAQKYNCVKIHLIGNKQFLRGLANNFKKHNTDFSLIQFEVN